MPDSTIAGTAASFVAAARSHHHTPSAKLAAAARAAASATRVLPIPPMPTTVINSCSVTPSMTARRSSLRPTMLSSLGGNQPRGRGAAPPVSSHGSTTAR